MADARIKAVITAEDRASGVVKGFGGQLLNIGKILGAGYLAKKLLDFGVASVKAFEESEKQVTQLNTVLKSTNYIAGITAEKAIALSKSFQAVTQFSDEDVLSVENLLLTFTKISKKIFPQATETVLNMATALGEDTKSASIQLGKALQDPILGITALRRVGVNFNNAQKEVVKKLVETGHQAKAQALILKELQVEFGGSAKAAGTTLAGSLAKLKNSANDLMEKIGGGLAPTIQRLAGFLQLLADDETQGMAKLQAFGFITGSVTNTVQANVEAHRRLKTAQQEVAFATKELSEHQRGLGDQFVPTAVLVEKLRQKKLALARANAIAKGTADDLANSQKSFGKKIGESITLIDSFGKKISVVFGKTVPLSMKDLNKAFSSGGLKLDISLGGLTTGAGHAAGGPVSAGVAYPVGEKGPEMFVPKSSGTIIPNGAMGGNVSLSVNIGMFAGTESEKRRIAKELYRSLVDIASSKNTSVAGLLGA